MTDADKSVFNSISSQKYYSISMKNGGTTIVLPTQKKQLVRHSVMLYYRITENKERDGRYLKYHPENGL